MQPMLLIQSEARGILTINGCFCGPLEKEGQAFPTGRSAEIYIQFFPFGQGLPLTAALTLSRGAITQLEPQESAYALLWPDGIIQLELAAGSGQDAPRGEEQAAGTALLRYLTMRLTGDPQAETMLMRAQDAPALEGYEAAVPLRFAPLKAGDRYDERAGLVRRLAPNIACVDAALAVTVPAGQGRRRIERIDIMRT